MSFMENLFKSLEQVRFLVEFSFTALQRVLRVPV